MNEGQIRGLTAIMAVSMMVLFYLADRMKK